MLPLLRASGHEVFTPTLTGLGDRVHLAGRDVNLSTHVQDVLNVLTYEDLHDVILVGHSYGGMVISAVAGRADARLARLVYLDAFVPQEGQAMIELQPPERRTEMAARVREEGDGWRLPGPRSGPWDELLRDDWLITDDADLQWVLARITPQPFATMTEPVRGVLAAEKLPRTYIRCTSYPNPIFDLFAAAAQQPGSGWSYRALATAHEAMITMPDELGSLLEEIAEPGEH